MSSTTRSSTLSWDEVVKKEARDREGGDLGEVQEVGQGYVLTQKGIISKDKFYLPKALVKGFDGETLWFDISEYEAKAHIRDEAPTVQEYARYKTEKTDPEYETRIPVIKEHANIGKTVSTSEAKITKEPYTETVRKEVPITHEEVTIEKRNVGERSTSESPITSKEEVRVPLSKEQVHVTKEPHTEEEVVIKKKPVTETQTVEEKVRGEKVKVNK